MGSVLEHGSQIYGLLICFRRKASRHIKGLINPGACRDPVNAGFFNGTGYVDYPFFFFC